MTAFRFMAYMAPPAAAVGVAAALAVTRGRSVRRRIAAACSAHGAVLLALCPAAAGESPAALHAVVLVTSGFALLSAGFFLFVESLRLPPEACQVAVGLLTAGLLGSVFLVAPALRHAEESGAAAELISRRIAGALDVNPLMVIGYSVFGCDLARSRAFYPLGLADYQFSPPRWQSSAAGYALAGFVFFAGALAVRSAVQFVRRQPAG